MQKNKNENKNKKKKHYRKFKKINRLTNMAQVEYTDVFVAP